MMRTKGKKKNTKMVRLLSHHIPWRTNHNRQRRVGAIVCIYCCVSASDSLRFFFFFDLRDLMMTPITMLATNKLKPRT